MPREMSLIDLPEPDWITLLKAEVSKPGKTITIIAREIGMPRPSLSLLLSGKYPAKLNKVTEKFAAKVIRTYRHQVLCPHLRSGISDEDCLGFANAPMSMSSPEKLRHYRACQRCPLNPVMLNSEVKDAV